MSEFNCRMPVIALRGLVVIPGTVIHFDVSREKSIAAIEDVMKHDQMVMLSAQKDPETEDPGIDDICRIGTAAKVRQIVRMPKNVVRVLAEGLYRSTIVEEISSKPYLFYNIAVDDTKETIDDPVRSEGMRRALEEIMERFEGLGTKFSAEIKQSLAFFKGIGCHYYHVGAFVVYKPERLARHRAKLHEKLVIIAKIIIFYRNHR